MNQEQINWVERKPRGKPDRMKRSALTSLLLLLPAPTLGVLFGMILMPGTAVGQWVFIFSKGWIFLLPALWFLLIEKGTPHRGKTGKGGFKAGLISGLVISLFIVAIYLLLGPRLIDAERVKALASEIGLDRRALYIGGAFYWIGVNSVLEEYVWRWFTVRQCVKLMKPGAAVIVSALGFTLHHIFALQVYFSPTVTVCCSIGVFIGGAVWSRLFIRYKTIWPGYVSHALVDIAVFGIGYVLIFS